MAKTLDAKLKLDNSEAKRKAKEVGDAAATGMDEANRSAKRFASSLDLSAQALTRAAAGMGGMLAGTAARYLALKSPDGSKTQKALDYGGSALQGAGQGAAMGAMFGPLGTAIGALVGAINSLANKFIADEELEKKKNEELAKTNLANREMVVSLINTQKRTDEFKSMINSLGASETDLADRTAKVKAEIEKRAKAEEELKYKMMLGSNSNADEAAQKQLAKNVAEYQRNHAELEQLRAVEKNMTATPETTIGSFRASMTAADSLSRIGGTFGGGSDYSRDLVQGQKDQLRELQRISEHTAKKGTATWL